MIGQVDLQFNNCFEPGRCMMFFTSENFLRFSEVRVLICEQKSVYTGLTKDRTYKPINESRKQGPFSILHSNYRTCAILHINGKAKFHKLVVSLCL